jgi:hypothetical protein
MWKNFVLNLLKQNYDLIVCWKALKDHYEFDVVPRKVMLIEKISNLKKTNNITMDVHLTQIKNVADQLKEIGRSLLEDILNTIHSKIYLWSRTCSKKCILAMINCLGWKVTIIHLAIQRIIDLKFGKTQMFFWRIEQQLSSSNSTKKELQHFLNH